MTYAVLDIETVGEPFDGRVLLVGFDDAAFTEGELADAWAPGGEHHPLRALADPDLVKVTFTKYDHRWLDLYGFHDSGPIHAVQVMAWLLDEAQDLSLEACARKYLGVEMDKRIYQIGGRVMFRRDDE